MHELDLIPASYRERQLIQRQLTLFISVFVALLLCMATLKLLLQHQTNSLQGEVQQLENGKTLKLAQQEQFNHLLAQERLLRQRLKILNSLQGGLSARLALLAFDRVFDGEVWFTEWSLLKTAEPGNSLQTPGGFQLQVIPEKPTANEQNQSFQLTTRMMIKGQALDHSKLADFVSRLMQQPEIRDVKVVDTNLKTYLSTQVIDFNMIVMLNNQLPNTHD